MEYDKVFDEIACILLINYDRECIRRGSTCMVHIASPGYFSPFVNQSSRRCSTIEYTDQVVRKIMQVIPQ